MGIETECNQETKGDRHRSSFSRGGEAEAKSLRSDRQGERGHSVDVSFLKESSSGSLGFTVQPERNLASNG